MAIQSFATLLLLLLLFSFLVAGSALGGVLLSDLPQTVEVRTPTQEPGERRLPWFMQNLSSFLLLLAKKGYGICGCASRVACDQFTAFQAGEDMLTVTWRTFPGAADEKYKMVKFMLCFAPISQHRLPGRKTKDNITEDKSCKTVLVSKPYYKNNTQETFHWMIKNDVPTATYFIRAYALNATGIEVAYGQSTDDHKTINLIQINGISSWISKFNITAVIFSAFFFVLVFGMIMCDCCTRARARFRNTATVNPLPL